MVRRKQAVAEQDYAHIDGLLDQALKSEEVDRWRVAKLNTAKMIKKRELELHREYLGGAGFWDKLGNHGFNAATIGIVDLVEKAAIILPTALKGQKDLNALDDADKELLKAYQSETTAMSNYAENAGWQARLGDNLGHSLPFLTGMMVTGGAGNAAKAAGMKATGEFTGTIVNKIVGGLSKVAVQSALMPMTYTETSKNLVGTIEYDADSNKVLMNEQIYQDFEQKINGKGGERDKLSEFVKSLNSKVTLDGLELDPETDKEYQDARARLGLESTSSLMSFDDLLSQVEQAHPERMGVARAFQLGYGASAAEVFAEAYIGKGLRAIVGKFSGLATTKLGQTYLNIERKIATALPAGKASGGLIQSFPEEFAEEVFVTPLHMINEWSTAPGKEWYDPEKGLQTKQIMDVALQTLVMGGAFGGLGGAMNTGKFIMNPKEYKKQKADRASALALFSNIKYSGDETKLKELIDKISV
jgi:hypothetical protein